MTIWADEQRRGQWSVGRGLLLSGCVLLAACGADGNGSPGDAVGGQGTGSGSTTAPTGLTDAAEQSSTTTASASSSSAAPSSGSTAPTVDEAEELRAAIGAEWVAVRRGDAVTVATGSATFDLADPYPGIHGDHLVADGAVFDLSGRPVCQDLELLGDFHVVADVATEGELVSVFVEDRWARGSGELTEPVDVPRWRFDCATSETTTVPSTTVVGPAPDGGQIVTTTTGGGLVLVAEWGLGDTPLRLTTGDGTTLLQTDALAYDYVLGPNERTVFATTYAGTGAASPPDGVMAIDVATGAERWRWPAGGFVSVLGDRLVIEEVDTGKFADGTFPGREVVVVDPVTGAELDRVPFGSRLAGLG